MELYDRVKVVGSSDPALDGAKASVLGFYGQNSTIILFDRRPEGYDPAIVVVNQIIEKVEK